MFCDGDGTVSRAAGELFCHRNTVLNRLERLRSLTGVDVRRPRDAAGFLFAMSAGKPAGGTVASTRTERYSVRRPQLEHQLGRRLDGGPAVEQREVLPRAQPSTRSAKCGERGSPDWPGWFSASDASQSPTSITTRNVDPPVCTKAES
ncbi:helix-turn-helix domain-containing protein [Pseudonocardia benzenivorans]